MSGLLVGYDTRDAVKSGTCARSQNVLQAETADVDYHELTLIAVKRAEQAATTAEAARELLTAHLVDLPDLRPYANGHDLAAGLSALIRHWGGACTRKMVERIIRSACSRTELSQTQFYTQIATWAARNQISVWAAA